MDTIIVVTANHVPPIFEILKNGVDTIVTISSSIFDLCPTVVSFYLSCDY